MMNSQWKGRVVVAGKARGPALLSHTPMSFLGDIDIRSGRVVDAGSDIVGEVISKTILVIPATHGSAGAWRFLYQLFQHGTNPVALLTEELPDPSIVQGAIMSGIPIVAGVSKHLLAKELEQGMILDVNDSIVSISIESKSRTGTR